MKNIMVSVLCTAYNHEKYIRNALDGFVMQKTNFLFEVLVHDDASTDKTSEIIREYAEKYPLIIKPIYQLENQYSKGISILKTYLYPQVKGKYIAFCEGDDYWTDEFKLQKQYDILENNQNLDGCVHAVEKKHAVNGTTKGFIRPLKNDGIISLEDVIRGGGEFIGTNSIMFRKEITEINYNFYHALSLDYVTQISIALRGGVYYLSESMSVYRVMAEGSWTSRMQKNPRELDTIGKRIITMLELLDEETSFKYHTVIQNVILERKGYMAARNGQIRALFSEPLRAWLCKIPKSEKLKLVMRAIKNYGKNKYEKRNS